MKLTVEQKRKVEIEVDHVEHLEQMFDHWRKSIAEEFYFARDGIAYTAGGEPIKKLTEFEALVFRNYLDLLRNLEASLEIE